MALPGYIVTSSAPVSDVADADELASTAGAGLIGIEDTAGNFAATTVEGALAELATGTLPFTTIYFGLANVDGTWRIRVNGGNLVFELRESGTYNEKSAVLP